MPSEEQKQRFATQLKLFVDALREYFEYNAEEAIYTIAYSTQCTKHTTDRYKIEATLKQ